MRLEKLEVFSGIISRWPSGELSSAVNRLSSGKDRQSSAFTMLAANLQHCMPQNLNHEYDSGDRSDQIP